MPKLVLFIGPPKAPKMDAFFIKSFLDDEGQKIICGGSTVSIFEKYTGQKAEVDFSTYSDTLPPYGMLGKIITTEGIITIKKLNEVFFTDYVLNNSAGILKKSIENAQSIKIYSGKAFNPVNKIIKASVLSKFFKNIIKTGIQPVIVDC